MSILIKGMEMPKSCYVCPFCDYVSARCDAVKGNPYTPENRYEKRADFCPLVPVPPHGRLIDETYLNMLIHTAKEIHANEKHDFCNAFDSNGQVCTEWWCVEDMIENAPTIIPADPPVMEYPQVPGITPTVISDKEGEKHGNSES